jgi:hypothetical protein
MPKKSLQDWKKDLKDLDRQLSKLQRKRDEVAKKIEQFESRQEVQKLKQQREKIARELNKVEQKISNIASGKSSAPAGKTAAKKTARRGGRQNRPKNKMSLEDTLAKIMQGKESCGVAELAQAATESGYKSNAANFRLIVNQTLVKSDRFKKVERGRYTLAESPKNSQNSSAKSSKKTSKTANASKTEK